MKIVDTLIIGGGISGLSAAWERQQLAPNSTTLILEKSDRLGGKIRTEVISGCTVEAGADSFLMRKPWAVDLCRELGIEDRLISTNQASRRVYVLKNGQLHPLPAGLRLIVPTDPDALRQSGLLSEAGCERMLAEETIPAGPPLDDESIASFVRRRFGQECLDVLAQPMLAGLFVGDADSLSLAATFPEYLRMEQAHGSLIRAAKQAPAPTGGVTPNLVAGMFASLQGGMQELIATLREKLKCEKQCRTDVLSIEKTPNGWTVTTTAQIIQASNLILALPMHVSGKLLQQVDPSLAADLQTQRYASSATISLAFKRDDAMGARELDGYGVIIPEIEDRDVAAMSWTSTKIPSRAPTDHLLLRIFLGGKNIHQQLQQTDHELTMLARQEVAKLVGIEATPVFTKVYRYENATPRFDVGHIERVASIENRLKSHKGLALCSCDYRGFGIPDSIKYAREAARFENEPD